MALLSRKRKKWLMALVGASAALVTVVADTGLMGPELQSVVGAVLDALQAPVS